VICLFEVLPRENVSASETLRDKDYLISNPPLEILYWLMSKVIMGVIHKNFVTIFI